AVKEGKLDMIPNLITREGFEIIQQAELTGDQQTRAAVEIRGRNWGKGPWMKEGGGPAVVIVAFDLIPKVPSPYEKMRYPHLDNQRTLVKERIRNTYNARLKKSERCNILHASDNTAEAYEYIETIWDDSMVDVLQRKIADKQKTFVSVFPVRKNLTGSGRRAKIELIEYKGSLAIHKKFRPQSLRYLEREKYAYQELSAKIRHIPPCLDAGADYIILPVFEPSLQRLGLLPLKAVKAVYNVLESLFREGLFWGDATPQNVCFDKYGNVVCIDFEFLQRYQVQPATIQDGFDVGQTPQSSTYDFPGLRLRFEADTFEKIWTPVCGLTFEQISTPHSDVYYQTRRMLYFCQHIPAQFTIVLSKKIKRSLRSKIPILGKRVIRFIDTAIDRCLFKR
ncbi:MAG: hypothetical protein KDD94_15360, partial [Calditrichaeota bacterium]|nr:hypothetical protein [Calditrichota bacterium]